MYRSAAEGSGKVVLQCFEDVKNEDFGHAEAVTIQHTYPLKFLLPQYAGNKLCKWIFPITFGGGLVGGDRIDVTVDVLDNTCGLVTSQEATKIYHCDGDVETVQTFRGHIGRNALLSVLPDYLVCYKNARYRQLQTFEMSSLGNLLFLDWFTAGRIARQEIWEFTRYFNKIEVNIDGNLMFRDCVELHDMPSLSIQQSMSKYMVMGMCIILGKKMEDICSNLEKKFGRRKNYGEKYETDTVVSVSQLHYKEVDVSGLYIRFMATTTTRAYSVINEIVEQLIPILGADPYHNKY